MYTLKVIGKFAAAHKLPHYDGECNQLHGHTWKVIVAFKYDKLYEDKDHPRCGMAQDFHVLKKQLDPSLKRCDHKLLNEVSIKIVNPTAEILAKFIYDDIAAMNEHIVWVEVWESDEACVRYEPYTNPQEAYSRYAYMGSEKK